MRVLVRLALLFHQALGCAGLVMLMGLWGSGCLAQEADPWRLRAAFLYNFSQFIEWPTEAFPEPTASFKICVLGANRFGSALQPLEKRSVRGHPIVVLNTASYSAARSCHILYVSDSGVSGGKNAISALEHVPVLTVTEAEDSKSISAGIGFVEQGGRLRWVINLRMLKQLNLKVSAKLIEIAVAVIGE